MDLRCLIIDDEPLAREGLAAYAADVEGLEVVGTFANPLAALPTLEGEAVGLLLLDVEMPKLNGIDFLKHFAHPPLVILTTAYQQYALEGYELDVVDYLLKPITFPRFLKAVRKAQTMAQQRRATPPPAATPDEEEYFFVKIEQQFERVRVADILFVEGMQNYVRIYTAERTYLPLITLKAVEAQLPTDRFLRTHKSYLVAMPHVESVEGNELRLGEYRVPISRTQREAVIEQLVNRRLLKK